MRTEPHRKQGLEFALLVGVLVVVLALLVFAVGGGGHGQTNMGISGSTSVSGTPVPVPEYPVKIPSTTKIIPSTKVEQAVEVAPNAERLVFTSQTYPTQPFKVGDVIVGSPNTKTPNGFLRKVTDVRRDANGDWVVKTSQAALTDAIESGTLRVHKKITASDVAGVFGGKLAMPVKADSPLYINIKDTVIYDADGDLNTKMDQVHVSGSMKLQPTVAIEMGISHFRVQQADAYVDVDLSQHLHVSVGGTEKVSWNKELTVTEIKLKPIVVQVGVVPVVITPTLRIVLTSSGKVVERVEIEADGDSDFGFRAGAGYERGKGWFPIASHRETASFTMTPHLEASANAEFSVKGGVVLALYGVVGLTADLQPYLMADLDIQANPWWALYLGLRVPFSVFAKIWGHKLGNYDGVVLDARKQIAAASSPPPVAVLFTPTSPAPPPGPGGEETATVILVDVSGSMNDPMPDGEDKIDAAREAAVRFVHLLQSEDALANRLVNQAAVVVFSGSADTPVPLTDDLDSIVNWLQDNLFADGATALASGLQQAVDILHSVPTQQKRSIVLLSDGNPNISLSGDKESEDVLKNEVLEIARQAGSEGICIYVIGFGDPGAKGRDNKPSIDTEFLKEIAQSTCGSYYYAEDMQGLIQSYITSHHEEKGAVLLNQSGVIAEGDNLELGDVNVKKGAAFLRYTLTWPGSKLIPLLTDPRGRKVDKNYPGIQIQEYKGMTDVFIKNPIAGQWRVGVYGADVPEGEISYGAVVSSSHVSAVVGRTSSSAVGIVLAIFAAVLVGGGIWMYSSARTRGQGRAPAAVVSSAKLILPNGQIFPLFKDGIIVGRGSACDVRLNDRAVSRQHARLRYANGEWFIQDMGSSFGTFVNGQKVRAIKLSDGDVITLGKSTLVYKER